MKFRAAFTLSAVLVLLAAACAREEPSITPRESPAPVGALAIEVHRSSTCECCGRYEAYLRQNGVQVSSVIEEDVAGLKESLGIPADMRSCHTSLVEGYFVEGHVPLEAIRQLLDTRPGIDGIALPGMPPGAPGMEGSGSGPLTIYAIDGGSVTEFTES